MYKRLSKAHKIIPNQLICTNVNESGIDNEERFRLKQLRECLNHDIITMNSIPSLSDLEVEIKKVCKILNIANDNLLFKDKKLIAKFSVALFLWVINDERKHFLNGTEKMKEIVDEYINLTNKDTDEK